MNPETGRIERVVGTTSDGFDLFESQGMRLKFLPACRGKGEPWCFSFFIESNLNEYGKRRPHYGLNLFGLFMTGGWLFD